MPLITIDERLCTQEGACIDACPAALLKRGEHSYPVEIEGAYKACIRCGHCVAVCRPGALANDALPREGFEEIADLKTESDPLAFVMRTRRSIRAFREKPVPRTELKALFEVVRHAPTSNNTQSLWWIVTSDRDQTKALADLARRWMRRAYWPEIPEDQWPDDDPVLRGAPHLALCCAPEASRSSQVDAAIAVTHLDLLAASRGIGTCWTGVFLRAIEGWPPLLEALSLPPGQKVFGGLILGYPRHPFRLVPPRKPSAVDWR
ncbi:MAG: nitroreductase family protein [Humidesulfovibrio sp.]|nr:nitroreductase family protein [Humidesulfovibrio sp.]